MKKKIEITGKSGKKAFPDDAFIKLMINAYEKARVRLSAEYAQLADEDFMKSIGFGIADTFEYRTFVKQMKAALQELEKKSKEFEKNPEFFITGYGKGFINSKLNLDHLLKQGAIVLSALQQRHLTDKKETLAKLKPLQEKFVDPRMTEQFAAYKKTR
jgi:hypothetical protein